MAARPRKPKPYSLRTLEGRDSVRALGFKEETAHRPSSIPFASGP